MLTKTGFLKSSKSIRNIFFKLFDKRSNYKKSNPSDPWPNYSFSGLLRPVYPLSATRDVPSHIQHPDYADHPKGYSHGEMSIRRSDPIKILSNDEVESMRVVCKLARQCLDIVVENITPGMTTDRIDEILHQATIERNCYPSPLNYYNFPKSCCTSVNEVICHGIPDQRELQNGDIINVDVSCYYNGFHGDVSETIFVGEVDDESRHLVQTTYNCLMTAVKAVQPGLDYSEIGNIIERKAVQNGCTVNKTFCGHGINQLFHTNPHVPHYATNRTIGPMEIGHVFTIEPMLNLGTRKDEIWPDGWTAVTKDGKRSAQFEHTVLVTETGVDILTKRDGVEGPYFLD